MSAPDWLDEQVSGWGVPSEREIKPGPAMRFHKRLRTGAPLFADSRAASAAIGIALLIACAVVAWLLATGR